MRCMRCGRETEANQVFCPDCLKDMEKYPVKPGTSVQIPNRSSHEPVRKPRPKSPGPEEQIARLRHALQVVLLVLIAVLMAFAITAGLLIHTLNQPDNTVPLGQNFGSVQTPGTSGDR
ncbi:MAG: hypothetical protein IJX67_04715 [Oscillospiraceae bacterium]|nr:hypothetical protein [Oscillospiraceae bacterium]